MSDDCQQQSVFRFAKYCICWNNILKKERKVNVKKYEGLLKLIEQKIIPHWYKNLPHGTREPGIDYRGESDEMYKLDVI